MNNQRKLIGYYSEYQAQRYGYCLYKNSLGDVLKITEVCDQNTKISSRWNDNVCLGEVVECVKVNEYWHNLDLEKESLADLYQKSLELKQEEERCQKQFKVSNKCFCHTCPIPFNNN